MAYRFIVLADLHWGAMDSTQTYQHLSMVLNFIRRAPPDFVVIAGDYFDYRIQLNSKTTLLAIKWFDELMKVCQESGVKKVRMFKGTAEHDNDQMEVFRPAYEDDSEFFRLYTETTAEQLFEDLRVVYCPDEPINLEEYWDLRWDRFMPNPDIGFFHGNFDNVLPGIEYQRIQEHHLPTMIYEYEHCARLIKGPLISGHWHIGQTQKSLYYVGSYDRWAFGEEESKGFIYGEYNPEDHRYFIHRVINPMARIYKTLVVSDEETVSPGEFAILAEQIQKELTQDPDMKLKITYLVSTANAEAWDNFNIFQRQFANHRAVKFDVKNLIRREEQRKKKQQVQLSAEEYKYVYNNDLQAIPSIIQRFILEKRHESLPLETIEKYVAKYLNT